jgi:hypothetical protein
MGWDWGLSLMPYGSTMKKHRMFLHQFLHRTAMKRHQGILTLETHRLIAGLSDSPENYLNHVRRYSSLILAKAKRFTNCGRATAAIIMKITYGHESMSSRNQWLSLPHTALVGPLGDNYVKLADEALESVSTAAEPGAFLVDFLPSCASSRLLYSSRR